MLPGVLAWYALASIAAFVAKNRSPTVAQVQAMFRSAKRSSRAGMAWRTPRILAP